MLTRLAACDGQIQFVLPAYAGAGVRFAAILRPRFASIGKLLTWRGNANWLATCTPSLRVPMKYPG